MKKDYTKYSENTENKNIDTTETTIQEIDINAMTAEEKEARIATIKELMSVEGVDIELFATYQEELDKLGYVDENVNVEPEVETTEGTVVLVEDGNNSAHTEIVTEETEGQPEPNNDEETEVEELPVGVVTAAKLNVRKEASKEAEVECVVARGNEVTVNMEESTEDFYKVYGSCKEVLFEGYCVTEFIEIK